jgi:3-oxoacyl-[acyl-carrier protein] reductase
MDLGIAGKMALVVGASRGIGRAIALAFAREGCALVLVARDEVALAELAREARTLGSPRVAVTGADVMTVDSRELANQLLREVGQVDIVVQNVGGPMGIRDPLAPAEAWQKVWQYNVGYAIDMNSVLLPHMITRGWGRIVHVSSISAMMLRGSPQYASAKAFVNAYATSVGRAVAKHGVVVSAIMPTWKITRRLVGSARPKRWRVSYSSCRRITPRSPRDPWCPYPAGACRSRPVFI